MAEDGNGRAPALIRRRKRIRIAVVASVVVALVATVLGVIFVAPDVRCGGPLNGIRLVEGECVGTTDGEFIFDSRLAEVQNQIQEENEWAAATAQSQDTPLVKVALMATLTTTDESAMSHSRMVHALEGAYVALHRANRTVEIGDPDPLIQLYLANEGSHQQGTDLVVSQLVDMTEDEVPLVSVFGQSVSSKKTVEAAKELTSNDIPIVTGVATADGIDHASIPGLVRSAPSNTDFATALRQYVNGRPDLESAVLVYDSTEPDLFSETMRAAFEEHMGDYLGTSHQPFLGRSLEEGHLIFDPITRNVCASGADMVLYAGREPDLRLFIEALSQRACREEQLTLFFGETGSDLQQDQETLDRIEEGNLKVYHSGGFDPGWERGTVEPPPGYADFQKYYDSLVSADPTTLDNGYAVTYHDALMITVSAIRINNSVRSEAPTAREVKEHLLLLNNEYVVEGASGTLSFSENRGGNPGGKYMPIVPVPYPSNVEDYPGGDVYITPID